MKTKILFLANAPTVLGGVEKAILNVYQGLDRKEFEPSILLTGYGPFYEQLLSKGIQPDAFKCDGRYSLSWHRFLRKYLTQHRFAVVHLTARFTNVFLLRHFGLPIISRLNFHRVNHGLYPMRFKPLDVFCSRFVDAYVVVSKSIQEGFTERGYDPSKLHLIYNGISAERHVASDLRQELRIPADSPIVGTIGRMRHEKGMDVFLQTAGELTRRGHNIHFVIAGDGDERPALIQLTQSLGLEKRTHFLGFRSDPLNVLSGFDVLLYLSRWEAFSNTILEAMTIGVPVVTTGVGGNVEAIQHQVNGLLVQPEQSLPAADSVERLLRSPAQRSKLCEQARQDARLFSVDTMVQKHQYLFRSMVE